jgi:hypothetical protein
VRSNKRHGFSKKFERHLWMVGIYSVFYNFLKVHRTLRVTSAMESEAAKMIKPTKRQVAIYWKEKK